MSDRIPTADLERLCRALGFERIKEQHPPDRHFGEPGRVEEIWPPLDTSDTWARKAMERATLKAGVLKSMRFLTEPPVSEHYLWTVEALTDGARMLPDLVGTASTLPLAICGALLAALDAGELLP